MPNNSGLYGSAGNAPLVPANDTTSLYGASSVANVPDSNGDLLVKGNLAVNGGNITTTAVVASLFNTNATTLDIGGEATTVNLASGSGTTTINNNVSVGLGLTVNNATQLNGSLTTAGTGTFQSNVVVSGPLQVNNTGTFTGLLTAPDATFGNIQIAPGGNNNLITTSTGDLQLQPTTGNLVVKPATSIEWAENSTRSNRLNFKSTNGTSSGIRVLSPVATGGNATVTAFATNDFNNGKFVNISAYQAATNPLRVQTGNYTSGTLGPSGTSLAFIDGTTTYATVDPAGPTIGTDLTTKTYVDTAVSNVTVSALTNGTHTFTLDGSGYLSMDGTSPFIVLGPNNNTIEASSTGINLQTTAGNLTATLETFTTGDTQLVSSDSVNLTTGAVTTSANGDVQIESTYGTASGASVATNAYPATVQITAENYTSTNTGAVTVDSGTVQIQTSQPAGGVSHNWQFNLDGTTYFPNYEFPAADGTSNQVLRTNGSGVLSWYSPTDLNTTYTYTAGSTTGGANLTLTGSDSSVNTVKVASGTGITVADVNSTQISITNTGVTSAVAGTGIGVSGATGAVTFSNTGVTSNAAGTGISVNNSTGAVTITNTGVTSATAGTGIGLSGSTGSVTFSNTGVTSLTAGTGISLSGSTGAVTISSTTTSPSQLTNGSYTLTLNNDGTVSFPIYKFPYADGANGQVLSTNGSGTVSWINAPAGTALVNGSHSFTLNSSGVLSPGIDSFNVVSTAGLLNQSSQVLSTGNTTTISGTTSSFGSSPTASVSTNGTTGVTTINSSNSVTSTNYNWTFNADGSTNFPGTINGNLANFTNLLGEMHACPDTTITWPLPNITTASTTGYAAYSSAIAGTFSGNTVGMTTAANYTNFYGDTLAGANTSPAFTFQTANGNSVPANTLPWTGAAGTSASAVVNTNILGTFNFGGYATNQFASYIASRNQGGGLNATHPGQIQMYATETFANGTLTISGATITAVSRVSVALSSVSVTGTKGQISFTATTPSVGAAIAVTGTNTGTSTGISAGTYYIIATNGSTTATLSATPGGYPITTTAGTTTGLTFTRQFITVTYNAQSNIPFGLNALITISGFNNVTSGTYMSLGTSTTTTLNLGAPSSGTPSLSGSQSLSTGNVSNGGTAFRVRGFPLATPMNSGNRVNLIDHAAGGATYRADSFTFNTGAYGNTGTTIMSMNSTAVTNAVPVVFPNYTATQARAITGAVGWQICINNSAGAGNPNGMMAFWDTTNSRWSYIHDNSAV